MAPVVEFFSTLPSYLPWVSFMAGLGGGLHCVGMCGGLVAASCHSGTAVMRYQFGRLTGYVLLGLAAGLLGGGLQAFGASPWPAFLAGLLLGLLFIYWGVESWRGRRAELPLPRFVASWYPRLWRWIGAAKGGPFLVGFISLMLPCGLLYGVALGAAALQDPLAAASSLAFFWLGTLPSMVLAPGLLRRLLWPLKKNLPRFYGATLLIIGVATVGQRLSHLPAQSGDAHAQEHKSAPMRAKCH